MMAILGITFMERALLAGLLLGGLCAALGVFVVQRGLAFLGGGLAHAAFGGIALALLADLPPEFVALPFTVAVALAITWVRRRDIVTADTAIGIFFAFAMALGVIFIHLRERYASDVFAYLFGNILYVGWFELAVIGGAVLVAGIVFALFWGDLAYATFDEELARLSGVRTGALEYLLAALLAVVIVVSVKLIGILLVSSFLVIPPATARIGCRTLTSMTIVSVLCSVTAVTGGLYLSDWLGLPSGATIILAMVGLFAIGLVGRALKPLGS